MRKNLALIVMLAAQAGVAAVGVFFHVRSREAILRAFQEFGTILPPSAALALSPWFLPGALAFGGICALASLVLPLRRSQRSFVAGLGLLVSSCALIFAVSAAFLPIFNP